MTWHPPVDTLTAYVSGAVPVSQVWSIEAHVTGCDGCRQTVGTLFDDPDRLAVAWGAVVDRVDTPKPRVFERFLVLVGVPEYLARLLGATPSLTVPWLLAVVAVLGFGLSMAWASAGGTPMEAQAGLLVFLVLAPLVPLAGVAVVFGPVVDPAHEIAVASPFHGFRLLLVRTVAVVTASFVVALPLALLLPDAGWMAVAWILPGLALASVALAASTFVEPLAAVAASSVVWLVGVAAVEAGPRALVAFSWTGQLVFVVMLVIAVAVLLVRRESFEVGKR